MRARSPGSASAAARWLQRLHPAQLSSSGRGQHATEQAKVAHAWDSRQHNALSHRTEDAARYSGCTWMLKSAAQQATSSGEQAHQHAAQVLYSQEDEGHCGQRLQLVHAEQAGGGASTLKEACAQGSQHIREALRQAQCRCSPALV